MSTFKNIPNPSNHPPVPEITVTPEVTPELMVEINSKTMQVCDMVNGCVELLEGNSDCIMYAGSILMAAADILKELCKATDVKVIVTRQPST